jgi:hypothetical protein
MDSRKPWFLAAALRIVGGVTAPVLPMRQPVVSAVPPPAPSTERADGRHGLPPSPTERLPVDFWASRMEEGRMVPATFVSVSRSILLKS